MPGRWEIPTTAEGARNPRGPDGSAVIPSPGIDDKLLSASR